MMAYMRLTDMSVESTEATEETPASFVFHAEADGIILDHHGEPMIGYTGTLRHVESTFMAGDDRTSIRDRLALTLLGQFVGEEDPEFSGLDAVWVN